MAIRTIDDKHLSNIATAIRQKRGIEDTFKPSEMAEAIKDISGGEPILQEVVVQPSINEQTITPSADYDGLSQVKIGAVTSSIDSDIKPENIKKGVEILGVTGNIEDKPAEPVLQSKIVEPNIGKQVVTADSGYDGLGQVTVNEVTSSIDSNIKANNIKQGVSILGVVGNLESGVEVVKKYAPKFISFYGYSGSDLLEETKMLDTSKMTTFYQMFSGNTYLTTIDTSEWDTSNIITMNYMFSSCSRLENINVSNWDVGNVTTMQSAFSNCSYLRNLDVSNWNVSKVTNMQDMFQSCNTVYALDVSKWNTSSLTNARGLFKYCSNITTLDFSNWNTSKVTNMQEMFQQCYGLTTLDLRSFDTTNVTNMYAMFQDCRKLKTLDISTWNTDKVTSINSMFRECKVLEKVDMRTFTFTKVTSTSNAFLNVPANCLFIVKGDTEKAKILSIRSDLTNVKTLAEYQAEGGV